MKLEKLLEKIKDDAKKEINALKKEHSLEMKRIDEKGEEETERKTKEKENDLKKEREKILNDLEKEKEFQLKMDLLKEKKKLINEASLHVKKDIENLSFSEKKKIYQKKMEEVSDFLNKNCLVFVASGKKKELVSVFKGVPEKNIIERNGKIGDDFVIEGKNFVLNVSLADFVDKKVEEDIDFFADLLFKEK